MVVRPPQPISLRGHPKKNRGTDNARVDLFIFFLFLLCDFFFMFLLLYGGRSAKFRRKEKREIPQRIFLYCVFIFGIFFFLFYLQFYSGLGFEWRSGVTFIWKERRALLRLLMMGFLLGSKAFYGRDMALVGNKSILALAAAQLGAQKCLLCEFLIFCLESGHQKKSWLQDGGLLFMQYRYSG
ncbi:hypothetical protein BX600DRAFT_47747 [Xylariales sp. PMI_506]|nr:hypothetical protein BX600DRAFT_47747 [Xylariales sp. PMI_506]